MSLLGIPVDVSKQRRQWQRPVVCINWIINHLLKYKKALKAKSLTFSPQKFTLKCQTCLISIKQTITLKTFSLKDSNIFVLIIQNWVSLSIPSICPDTISHQALHKTPKNMYINFKILALLPIFKKLYNNTSCPQFICL